MSSDFSSALRWRLNVDCELFKARDARASEPSRAMVTNSMR